MNSKKHKLPRRILAMLLAICMFVTMFPSAMFAVEGGPGGSGSSNTTYTDKDTATEATGVTANKEVVTNTDGTYTINLSVQGYTDESPETQYQSADVALIIDSSGSMDFCGGTYKESWDGVRCERCGDKGNRHDIGDICTRENTRSKDRMDYAQEAATAFVNGLLSNDQIQVGLADFSGGNYLHESDYYGGNRQHVSLTRNSKSLIDAIEMLDKDHGDGTNYAAGLDAGKDILTNSNAQAKFIVFISDGDPDGSYAQPENYIYDSKGKNLAAQLKRQGITIITVGIDMSDGSNLEAISSTDEEGQPYSYTAAADGLGQILDQITETIEKTTYSGTNAEMTDVINTDVFELVPESLSANLKTEDNEKLTWKIGNIDDEKKTASFTIKVKDDNTTYAPAIPTNDSVSLIFNSSKKDGAKVEFKDAAIGVPTVSLANPNAPSNTINIDLYVDGNQVTDKTTYNQYLSVAPVATDWDPTSGYNEDSWDTGSYADGVVTYSRWHYDCKDINFTAQGNYVIEGIEAQVVNGQSGWIDFVDKEGTITVDNVNGESTVKVHLRSTYTVNYYKPDGKTIHKTQTGLVAAKTNLTANSEKVPKPVAGDKYDGEEYLEMENDQDPVTATGRQQPHNRVYVAGGLSNTTTVADLPDAAEGTTVNGWWIEGNDQSGEPTHKEGATYTVDPSDDESGDKIIDFYSKSTRIPANWGELTIDKTVDKETAQPGDTVTYTIKVTNNTGKDLTGVKVTDKLHENLTFVSSTPENAYADGVWTIDELANQGTATLTITAKVKDDVKDGVKIPNVATITEANDGGDKLPDEDKPNDGADVTVDIPADWGELTIDKTVDKETAQPGDTVTYTIKVTNNTGKDLTGVQVTDELDDKLIFVSATPENSYENENGVWTIDELANQGTATLTITAKVKDDVKDGVKIPNVATITEANDGGDKLPDEDKPNDGADVTVDIPADWGELTIDKTVDKETAQPGDTVTYTIKVTNNTGKDLTGVQVTDELDDEKLALKETTGDGTYANDVWTIGELKNGSSATLTIKATVKDDVAGNTVINNIATITEANDGGDNLPDKDKPSDGADVTVEPKDPTPEDISKLINGAKVTVNCTNDQAGHESLTVKFGEVNGAKFETTRSGNMITVTVDNGAFIANYVAKRNNIPHSYVEKDSDLTLTLNYVESGWVLDSEDDSVTINTVCELPQPPTDDELIKLLNEATADVECITTGSNHNKESFNFGEVTDYKFTTEQTDPYTITVEVDPAAFIENYDEVYKPEVHTFVQSEEVKQDVQLVVKFVDGAWTLAENTINIKVSCGFDLTGVNKTLITTGELENAAKDAGVEVTNYFLPASMEDTVTVPYNGSVTLLYAITVEGKGGADFAVQDPSADLVNTPINTTAQISKDDMTGMFIGMIPEGANSVTFYVSRTFTTADIKDGVLSNTVELFGQNGSTVEPDPDTDNKDEETIPAEEGTEENVVKITPADITVYEGGNGGYNGVVDNGNDMDADSNMPHPMFYISVPDGSDPTNLTFTNDGKVWTVVADGTDANGKMLYHFEQGTSQEPVRVTYTYDKDGKVVTVNDLSQLGDIGEVFTYLSIDLYAGENNLDDVRASFNGKSYAITTGSGRLTVRAVEADDPNTVTSDIRETAPTTDEGTAVAVEPENTTYTLNNTDVELPEDSQPSLLFDNIINDDGVNRTDALENKADQKLNANDGDYNYEIMYLDLVDANNGNAWITSSGGTDIYWDYPEGTDKNTDFEVLHFTGLHRDGEESGFDINDLNTITMDEIENVEIEKTDNYIVFHVTEANFSPYALAWETDNGGNQGGGGWTPDGGDDGPDGLNTEDHFSYIVGYAEDYRTGEPTDNEDLWPVKPNNQITRAEVATIFYRLLEDEVRDEYDTTVNDFSDVSADSWYNQTVSTLASMEIVKGYEDGTFRPNAPITRAEFGAIATRFFAETGATYVPGTFSDVTGDEWYANAIQDAVNLGLIGGYEDGTVRPNNNITRAEACAIVNRTLGRVPDADHLLPDDVMKTWPDNPESAWFYADMQEATNGHEYSWITEDGNEVEEWISIMLDNDWTDR